MIRLVKSNNKNLDISETAKVIELIQKFISNYNGFNNWYSLDNHTVDLSTDDVNEFIVDNLIKEVKKVDNIRVDASYKSDFGFRFFFLQDLKSNFSVSYNISMEESEGIYSSVILIKKYSKYLSKEQDLLSFFKGLIEIFEPKNGVITNEEIVYDIFDFEADDIWTGEFIYLSNDYKLNVPNEFEVYPVKKLGQIIKVYNKLSDQDNMERLKKISKLISSTITK